MGVPTRAFGFVVQAPCGSRVGTSEIADGAYRKSCHTSNVRCIDGTDSSRSRPVPNLDYHWEHLVQVDGDRLKLEGGQLRTSFPVGEVYA
jgi:hypothetical protein